MKNCEEIIPPETVPQVEDVIEDLDEYLGPSDDSDIPIQVLVGQMMENKVSEGFSVTDTGSIIAECRAEAFESECEAMEVVVEELGRGKRMRRPNQLYSRKTFWRHDDNDDNADSY